jgi:hypothetical protein
MPAREPQPPRQGGEGGAEAIAALREAAASALERALAFVDAHGDGLSRLRARAILGAATAQDAADAVAARQRPDGSFPRLGASLVEALGALPEGAAPEELLGTLDALAALAEQRALHHPCLEATVAWLARAQRDDGSWEAAGPEERFALTGMLGGFLARTRIARPELVRGAADFLAAHWSPEALERQVGTRAAAAAQIFSNAPHDLADEVLQWCGRELERGFRTGRLEALAVADALVRCEALALPGFGVGATELLAALLGEQARDGGFAALAAGGAPSRVVPTLGGLVALLALCSAL